VLANAWGIRRDEAVFGRDVDEFIPERWLERSSTKGEDWNSGSVRRELPSPFFGYGRRMCTGRLLAEDGLWIVVARLLWAFDIESVRPLPDPLVLETHGFTITPSPFKVVLKPRGLAEDVIKNEWESAEKDLAVVLGPMPQSQ